MEFDADASILSIDPKMFFVELVDCRVVFSDT